MVPYRIIQIPWCVTSLAQPCFWDSALLLGIVADGSFACLYSVPLSEYVICLSDGNDTPVCETAKEMQMCRTDFWTLWERERVG